MALITSGCVPVSCPIDGFPFENVSAAMEKACANPEDKRSLPKMKSLLVSPDGCRAVVVLSFATELVANYGAPQAAYLEVLIAGGSGDDSSNSNAPHLNLSLTLVNKTSTRLPEATWFGFKNSKNKNGWEMNKLGSWVDPTDVVDGGNQYQHGIHTGVRHKKAGAGSTTMNVHTLDSILVAPVTTQPALKEVCSGSGPGDKDISVGCKDIWCTWQGTPTALPGGGTRGAGLAPLEEVVGMAFNLHNNMWSINYPVFSPYENTLWDNAYDDRNFQFRFAIDFSSEPESV